MWGKIMSKKISFTPNDLTKIDPNGYFLNLELPLDFQIDRFADRSHMLSKDYKGTTALIRTYSFSMDTLKETSEFCQLIITTEPVLEYKETIPQFIVKDLRQFMYTLAKYMRENYHNPLIGVTGSAGKSTTSKMLWRLLRDEKTDAMVNLGNHNNRPSVSFYTSNVVRNPDYTVLEIAGDSLLEERLYGNLAKLANPDVGIITAVGGAHLSKYKDDLQVAEIKSGLIEGMRNGGLLVVNQDILPEQMALFKVKAEQKDIRIMTYSMHDKDTDACLISKTWDGEFSTVKAKVKDEIVTYRLPGGSEGTIQNSLGVLVVLKFFGITLDKKRLKKFEYIQTLPRVLTRKEFEVTRKDSVTIIDDSHNSSVPSMLNAISYFKLLATSGDYSGKKLLILAKIADLGPKSQEIHYQFIDPIVQAEADYVLLYGPQMKEIMKELRKQKVMAYHYSDLDELIEEAIELMDDQSITVIKGSTWESDFENISWKLPQKINQLGGKQV